MQYLLLIHVGPVQDFIATARRSRDLWFGSWLLSELSKAAARAIVEQEGGSIDCLIFPAPADRKVLDAGSNFNVANKIVALVHKPPDTFSKKIEDAIRQRLKKISEDALSPITGPARKITESQVDNLLEYFWVALSLQETEYANVRERTEALMAARKVTRNFNPVTWGSNSPKSSLDGSRESVIPENAYPTRQDNEKYRLDKIAALYSKYGAGPAERLSGVDLLKRRGHRGSESHFPSTSHMASLPLLIGLSEQKNVKTLWDTYIQHLPEQVKKQERVPDRFVHSIFGTIDGSVLFESRLAESLEGEALQKATQELNHFIDSAAGGKCPIPYYALLLADGDRMGQVINAQLDPDQHRQLSRTLDQFADDAKKIVDEEHKGALVYAGGDDVLAFLPLHTALDCARKLARTFEDRMCSFKDETNKSPTFSVGIAVSHHLEPLSDALNLARQAEKKAKDTKDKNALAIAVSMRGGVTRIVRGNWGRFDKRLRQFIKYHRLDAVPDGAAYQLRDTVLRLGGDKVIQQNKMLQEVIRQEGVRILSRKKAERGITYKLSKDAFEELQNLIIDKDQSMEQLADELIITRLFADAYNQACIPVE